MHSRLDLMNARAQVVDAWRQLRVTANALMGVATVQYNLQAQTTPGGVRPLAFSPEQTSQQLALNFQLPLNRLAQRNAYRTAQIDYQVALGAALMASGRQHCRSGSLRRAAIAVVRGELWDSEKSHSLAL